MAVGEVQRMAGTKRLAWLVVAVIIAVGAGGAARYWLTQVRGFESTDNAAIDGRGVVVSAKSLGRIAVLAVDEGDRVAAGQVLVRLDDSDLRAQEALAASGIVCAERGAALARVNLERAAADFDRAARLYAQRNISQEQAEHARSAAAAAEAQLGVVLAQVDSARAALGVVEAQLRNAVLTSPVAGVVARRWVSAGEVVQAAQAILTVYDLDNVWVSANFEETKLSRLRVGAPVAIVVDAHPGVRVQGKVVSIGSATAAQFSLIPSGNAAGNFTKITQRIPVKISVERGGSGAALLPGMSVTVRVSAP